MAGSYPYFGRRYGTRRSGLLPAPIDALRAVSSLNYVAGQTTALASGHTEFIETIPFLIGSGDVTSLATVFNNWSIAPSGTNSIVTPGNTITVLEAWVERSGTLTRLTFGGSNTRTLADGEYDVLSSEITAAVARGGAGFLHLRGSVPSAALKVPTWTVDHTRFGAFVARSYDPAVTTPTIGLGGWTTTGTVPATMARAPAIAQIVGRYASGDPVTFLGIGDSMFAGTFDVTGTGQSPRGMFMRALHGSGGADALAGITCAVSGGKPDPWYATTNAAAIASLVKYCNTAVVEFAGLNTFPTAGAANAFPTGETSTRSQWTQMYARLRAYASTAVGARAFRVIQVKQTPRISAASVSGAAPNTVALAVASQSPYGPQWDLGGDAKKLLDYIVSIIGQPSGADLLVNLDSAIRASTDETNANWAKFFEGANTDLVHFGPTLCQAVAALLRAGILA